MCMNSICAGIVTYNPDLKRLKENLSAVVQQVKRVFIVDNGSENISDIEKLQKTFVDTVLLKNKNNMGIAHALNQLIDAARDEYAWILTLDQDSVIRERLVEKYCEYIKIPDIGLLCCEIEDRNYTFTRDKKNDEDLFPVKKCITSGTLTNIDKCLKIGGFDDELFIDSVDYDLCYSMSEHGYKTMKVNYLGLLHEVGKSRLIHFGKFEFAVNNHSALRKYYISRNSVYLISKHHLNPVIEYFYVYRRIFTVLFFEENKVDKIRAIIKGIHDGREMSKRKELNLHE